MSLQHKCVKKRSGLDTLDAPDPVFDGVAAARTRCSRSAMRGHARLPRPGPARPPLRSPGAIADLQRGPLSSYHLLVICSPREVSITWRSAAGTLEPSTVSSRRVAYVGRGARSSSGGPVVDRKSTRLNS